MNTNSVLHSRLAWYTPAGKDFPNSSTIQTPFYDFFIYLNMSFILAVIIFPTKNLGYYFYKAGINTQ